MKGKILVVDDQEGIRILLKEILRKEGYQVYQAADGLQALHITKMHNPHLVLLDMRIPGMNGAEILKHMKEMKPKIRVIIMTAYSEKESTMLFNQLGALTQMNKPFNIVDVLSKVNKYIQRDGKADSAT